MSDPKEKNYHSYIDQLITDAQAGSPQALEELSKIAFGGNEKARKVIDEIDSSGWTPLSTLAQGIIWPGQENENWTGPKLGDIPLHNNQ